MALFWSAVVVGLLNILVFRFLGGTLIERMGASGYTALSIAWSALPQLLVIASVVAAATSRRRQEGWR